MKKETMVKNVVLNSLVVLLVILVCPGEVKAMSLINKLRTETFYNSGLVSSDQKFLLGLFGIALCVILAIVYYAFKKFQFYKRNKEMSITLPKLGLAKAIVLNICIFIVLFFLLEGWVKIVYPEGRGYLGKFFEHDEYAIWKQKVRGEHVDQVQWSHISNNLGLRRIEDTKLQKPKGTYRILFMGGSAAWGLTSGRATIDFFLEELIQNDFPNTKIEVLNTSAVGYKSYQHLIRYITFLRFLDPDMVIIMDGHNDYYEIYDPITKFYDHQYSEYLWPITDKSLTAAALVVARNLGEFSNIFNLLYTLGASNYAKKHVHIGMGRSALEITSKYNLDSDSGFDQFRRDYAQSFKNSIVKTYDSLHALLEPNNIEFVIASQPELILRDKKFMTSKEKSYLDWWLSKVVSVSPEKKAWESYYRVFPGLLQEAADDMSNTTYLNLQELTRTFLGKHSGLLDDYCHLSEEGSRYTAEVFYSHLKGTLEKRIGSKLTKPG